MSSRESILRHHNRVFYEPWLKALEGILAWSVDKPTFNTEFVESCLKRLKMGGYMSKRQCDSLVNVIKSYRIPVEIPDGTPQLFPKSQPPHKRDW